MTELKEEASDILDEESYQLDLKLPNNDQTWLYAPPGSNPNVVEDLSEWLNKRPDFKKEHKHLPKQAGHVIDSRTFTRPKKQNITVNESQMNSCVKPFMKIEESKFVQGTSASVHQEIIDESDSNKVACNISYTVVDSQRDLTDNDKVKHVEFDPLLTENLSLLMDYTCPNLSFNSNDQFDISRECDLHTTIQSPPQGKGKQNLPEVDCYSKTPKKSAFIFIPKAKSTPIQIFSEGDNNLNSCLAVEMLDNTNNNMLGKTFDIKNNNLIEEEGNSTFTVPVAIKNNGTSIQIEDANNVTFSLPCADHDKILTPFGAKVDYESDFVPNPSYTATQGPQSTTQSDATFPILLGKIDVANMNQYNGQVSKERDCDSAPDSCYSSSSNIRSLGDVHVVSQQHDNLQYTKIRKAVSHDSLLSQPVPSNITVPEKHESDANLACRTGSTYELPKEIAASALPKGGIKYDGANKCKEKSNIKHDAAMAHRGGSRLHRPLFVKKFDCETVINQPSTVDKPVKIDKPSGIPIPPQSRIPRASKIPKPSAKPELPK